MFRFETVFLVGTGFLTYFSSFALRKGQHWLWRIGPGFQWGRRPSRFFARRHFNISNFTYAYDDFFYFFLILHCYCWVVFSSKKNFQYKNVTQQEIKFNISIVGKKVPPSWPRVTPCLTPTLRGSPKSRRTR